MIYLIYIPVIILAALFTLLFQRNKTPTPDLNAVYKQQTSPLTDTMSTSKLTLRPFSKLGGSDHGWLNTRHHFSFADYYDPRRMNWGALRVVNDDIIASGTGFPAHPHRSMEIVTFVLDKNFHPATNKLEGGAAIKHGDNTGNKGLTDPGDVQVMSVGSDGVVHSEFHPGTQVKDTTNILQIWIMPDERIQKSTWGTRHFPRDDASGKFVTFASGFKEEQGDNGGLPINSLSRVVGVRLQKGESSTYKLGLNRMAYAVVTKGTIKVNGDLEAHAHDGIAIDNAGDLKFEAIGDAAEVLLIDTHPAR